MQSDFEMWIEAILNVEFITRFLLVMALGIVFWMILDSPGKPDRIQEILDDINKSK